MYSTYSTYSTYYPHSYIHTYEESHDIELLSRYEGNHSRTPISLSLLGRVWPRKQKLSWAEFGLT